MEEKKKKTKVSFEEQKRQGLIRQPLVPTAKNYVPTVQKPVITRLPDQNTNITYDVTPSSQQMVKFETSAVDRAKGFHIMITPMAWLAGGVVLAFAIFFKNVEIWSLLALLIYSLSTLVCWLLAWGITLLVSPEVVSFYESKRKWDTVEREQTERHKYYRGEK